MDGYILVEKLSLMLGSALTPAAIFGAWRYLIRDTTSIAIDKALCTRDLALEQAQRLRADGYVAEAQDREMDAFQAVARVFARFSFYRSHPKVVLVELLYPVTLVAVVVTSGLAIVGVPGAIWFAVTFCLLAPFVALAFLLTGRWSTRTISRMARVRAQSAFDFYRSSN
ncbi:hypothetical protein [Rhodococcus sovatensis]|uniref:ABC transmembrane type-1 domain-containing protein n=1 Tax=Rhodococcus sovatensis TaxID=1805840 RepID=A0ABZ2PR80_9NOCA